MRKISGMYQYSGGTDYRHLCHECSRCVHDTVGKRTIHRCLNYGRQQEWNEAHIACKFFGKTVPPLTELSQQQEGPQAVQMELKDFISY